MFRLRTTDYGIVGYVLMGSGTSRAEAENAEELIGFMETYRLSGIF